MIANMTFTSDWTTSHAPNWERWLGHLKGTPCRGLEIGVFEARSSAWFLENICTNPKSMLVAVDPWEAKSRENRNAISAAGYGLRYQFHADRSEDCLSRWYGGGVRFDFIYLDGGKEAARVMDQSVLAWRMLAPGGILIWDDYGWKWTEGCPCARPAQPPAVAIDAFLAVYAPELEMVSKAWQVAVRKTAGG
jgi:predicted O-methyltransferase YrrM